jgi:hypothetical protein
MTTVTYSGGGGTISSCSSKFCKERVITNFLLVRPKENTIKLIYFESLISPSILQVIFSRRKVKAR